MSEQYFARTPHSKHDRRIVIFQCRDKQLTFLTDSGVFSKDRVDRGTEVLLDSLEFRDGVSVLDLGCGYGVMGICFGMLSPSSRVVMSDVNERALKLARENVKRNAVSNVDVVEAAFARHLKDETFDLVLCNPPLRSGKRAVHRLVLEARGALKNGGEIFLVARTRQGAGSLLTFLGEKFEEATIVKRSSGYKVLRAVKRRSSGESA